MKFWGLKKIFRSKLSLKAKTKISESYVIPVLCYGAESWALTGTQVNNPQKTQRAMELAIIEIKRKERMRNQELRRLTKVIDEGAAIKNRKLSMQIDGQEK